MKEGDALLPELAEARRAVPSVFGRVPRLTSTPCSVLDDSAHPRVSVMIPRDDKCLFEVS